MATANNPAGRLYNILKEAKDKRDLRGKKGHEVWSALLNVPNNNRALLLKRLGQLMEQIDQAKELIRRDSDVDHDVYLRWTGIIENSFSTININDGFSSFIDPITDVALHGLEFCKDRLSRKAAERLLNHEERERISADAKALMDEVLSSSLDDAIRRFILDRLDAVIQALDAYAVCGARPLEAAVQATIGICATQKEMVTRVESAALGKKMWKILGRAAILSEILSATLQLTDFAHDKTPAQQVQIAEEHKEPTSASTGREPRVTPAANAPGAPLGPVR